MYNLSYQNDKINKGILIITYHFVEKITELEIILLKMLCKKIKTQ
jgi:hypothetical protein